MSDRRPWWAFGCSDELTAQDRANMLRVNASLFLLVTAWLAALLILDAERSHHPALLLVTILPVLAGIVLFRTVARFLREADELTRRMQVEALAFGFGTGFAAILLERLAVEAVELLGATGAWTELPDLFDPLLWMMLGYSFHVIRQQRRYRQ